VYSYRLQRPSREQKASTRMATTIRGSVETGKRLLNLEQYRMGIGASSDFFDPALVYETSIRRLYGFDLAYKRFSLQNRTALGRIEQRLRPFGYSLRRGQHFPYRCGTNILSAWEL